MAHIVFVLESYPPEWTANVQCVKNVIDWMTLNRSDKITCICGTRYDAGEEIHDGIAVKKIKHIPYSYKVDNETSKIRKIIRKVFHLFHSVLVFPFFPNVELRYSRKLHKTLESVHRNSPIDCVVASFRPFATIAAMTKFKKKHKNIQCVGYFLDILSGANPPVGLSKKSYLKLCEKREYKLFAKIDQIILPEKSCDIYSKDSFSVYREKFSFTNFPTLVLGKSEEKVDVTISERKPNAVFAGTTDDNYRNPMFAVRLFSSLSAENNIEFHIYGASSLEKELVEWQNKNIEFFYHGLVPKAEADRALADATYVVNIGNNFAGMVPSKTFELIAMKKPIIHFTCGSDDSALEYMKKYPNALLIDCNNSIEEGREKLLSFLNSEKSKISDRYLMDEFYSATPQATAEIITRSLGLID